MIRLTLVIVAMWFCCVQDTETVYVQPLGKVSPQYVSAVKNAVESFYRFNCIVLPACEDIKALLAGSRTRYDANKILNYFGSSSQHILVLTERDIAIRKSATVPEWGVFGLGKMPGKVCVVSSFRLRSSSERIAKVTIHEIGHNLGLDHCTADNTCLMSAANGKLRQVDQEKFHFCNSCKSKYKPKI